MSGTHIPGRYSYQYFCTSIEAIYNLIPPKDAENISEYAIKSRKMSEGE